MMEKVWRKINNKAERIRSLRRLSEALWGRTHMMEITREDRRSVIDHCYLAYFISGMVILIFGVILPNLIEERNLSFTAAGGLLSFLAIGNFAG